MYTQETTLTEKSFSLESFFSLFQVTYESDYFFPGETHNFWEMVYVIDGNICACADKNIFHLSAGDIIFHKPMELHKFNIENKKPATLFIMTFSASGALTKQFENCVLHLSSEQKQVLSNMISFLHSECALVDNGNHAVLEDMKKNSTQFQIFICMAELFFLTLSKEISTVNAIIDTSETQTYRKAIRIMEKRIKEWITVPEIAKECEVSASYLKKVFSKYAGLGVHQYFLKMKMSYASRLLNEGKNVTETAEELSFNNSNYFSTVFKRETGVSPSQYRSSL